MAKSKSSRKPAAVKSVTVPKQSDAIGGPLDHEQIRKEFKKLGSAPNTEHLSPYEHTMTAKNMKQGADWAVNESIMHPIRRRVGHVAVIEFYKSKGIVFLEASEVIKLNAFVYRDDEGKIRQSPTMDIEAMADEASNGPLDEYLTKDRHRIGQKLLGVFLSMGRDPSYAAPAENDPNTDVDLTFNIHQRINAIKANLKDIAKTGHNEDQDYDFIEQKEVIRKLKPLMNAWGVQILPSVKSHELISRPGGNKVIVHYDMEVLCVDKPTDRFTAVWVGEGDDKLDKGTNKAATAAEKTYKMKLFDIIDPADPDASSFNSATGKNEKKPTPKPLIYDLPRRKPHELMNDDERKIIYRVLVKKGFVGDEQKEVLAAQGYTDASKMTHADAIAFLEKISQRSIRDEEPAPQRSAEQILHDYDSGKTIDQAEIDRALDERFHENQAADGVTPAPRDLVVDDDLKEYVTTYIGGLNLNPRGIVWLARLINGKIYLKYDKFTDGDWRYAHELTEQMDAAKLIVPPEYLQGPKEATIVREAVDRDGNEDIDQTIK